MVLGVVKSNILKPELETKFYEGIATLTLVHTLCLLLSEKCKCSALLNATVPGSLITQESFSQTGSWNHQLYDTQGSLKFRTLRGPLILVSAGQKQSPTALGELEGWVQSATAAVKRGSFYTRDTECPPKVQNITRELGCICLPFVQWGVLENTFSEQFRSNGAQRKHRRADAPGLLQYLLTHRLSTVYVYFSTVHILFSCYIVYLGDGLAETGKYSGPRQDAFLNKRQLYG